jgi:hypothetical protein
MNLKTFGVTELLKCHKSCQIKSLNMVKNLSKNCLKVVKNWQKFSKSFQKMVKILSGFVIISFQ